MVSWRAPRKALTTITSHSQGRSAAHQHTSRTSRNTSGKRTFSVSLRSLILGALPREPVDSIHPVPSKQRRPDRCEHEGEQGEEQEVSRDLYEPGAVVHDLSGRADAVSE